MCTTGDHVELVKPVLVYQPGATGNVTGVRSDGRLLVTVNNDPGGNPTPFPLPPRDKSHFKKI